MWISFLTSQTGGIRNLCVDCQSFSLMKVLFIKTFYFHFLGPLIIFTTLNGFPKTLVEIGFIKIHFLSPAQYFCKYIFFFHLPQCVIKHVKVHISLDISLERAGYLYFYLHIISPLSLKTTANTIQTWDHFKPFQYEFPFSLK